MSRKEPEGRGRPCHWVKLARSFGKRLGVAYAPWAGPISASWHRLILAHLEYAASPLGLRPDAPPDNESARERRIREIE